MLDTINKFNNIFDKIDIRNEDIKTIHVFDKNNALFITIDDKVFGFSSNMSPVFGPKCGRRPESYALKEFHELNNKKIQYFFSGYLFALALSSGGEVYSWGWNRQGQLGRLLDNNQTEDYTPKEVKFPDSENFLNPDKRRKIVDISCGKSHVLALTLNGTVFGWGRKYYGQVGCGLPTFYIFNRSTILTPYLTPYEIKFKDSELNDLNLIIKAIYCFEKLSFALTIDGMAYSWGTGSHYRLGYDYSRVMTPKLINISNVVSICSTLSNTYFLTNEGNIYFCGKCEENNYQKSPEIINSETKFSSIDSLPSYNLNTSIASTVSKDLKSVFKISENKIIKTESKTAFDFYEQTYGITLSTEHIVKRLDDFFMSIEDLSYGGFGDVCKAINILDNKVFAIKRIDLEKHKSFKKYFIREIETLNQCNDSDYVVQYYSHWFESNYLYIQMELCSDDLQNIIKQKLYLFGRIDGKAMTIEEYFISIELFKELVECVHYLHESKVIHRDLKPQNVLIIENPRNNRFLKLCDFGLAKFGGETNQKHTTGQGTPGFMAPEISRGNYNNKVDIYNLGNIATILFGFLSYAKAGNVFNVLPKGKRQELVAKINKMTHKDPDVRPKPSEILEWYQKWKIPKKQIKILQTVPLVLSNSNGCVNGSGDPNLQKINIQFFQRFIETKLKTMS